LFLALAALATAGITVLTVFDIVHWSKAQTALASTEAGAVVAFLAAVTLHFLPTTKNEPVALAATFTAAISATLALGTGFLWWHLTANEVSALVAVVTAVIGVGTAIGARGVVTPDNGPSTPTASTAPDGAAA
jgi:hypothetical protein